MRERKKVLNALREETSQIIDCHTHIGISFNNYVATSSYPYSMCIEDLLVRMDFLGIDRSVVFPFESSYYPLLGEKKRLNSPAVSSFPYEKENRNLMTEVFEIFPEHSDRFIAFAMFDPTNETSRQTELLEELNERYPLCGLKTVTTYIQAFVKDFLKPDNKIRDFALRNNFPLTFHCSWIDNDPWANVFDVLEIVKALPELNFALAHTARFSRKALDMAAELPNCFVDVSAFKIHCDLAVMKSPVVGNGADGFEADYADPVSVLAKLAETYPETIIWGTDTPYHYFAQKHLDQDGNLQDSRLMAPYDCEIKILRAIPENARRSISYKNTLNYLSSRT
ncbi:MAG: amidohydrolase family protein [Victivallales bacterium]|nr:amidohydrolase family protein [Victivallales bacterium]